MLRRLIRRVLRGSRRADPKPTASVRAAAVTPDPVAPEPIEEEISVEIETDQLRSWLSDGKPVVLLDIREDHEIRSGHAEGALLLRMNDIPSRTEDLPKKSDRIVVYCAAGARSFGVTHWLREQGWEDAWSLVSGFSGTVDAGVRSVKPDQ